MKNFIPVLTLCILCSFITNQITAEEAATTEIPAVDIPAQHLTIEHSDTPQDLKAHGTWLTLIKKHGWSALIGSLMGALCGSTTAITNPLFDRNECSSYNFLLFTVLKSLVLVAISQDAKKYKLDFDLRTAFAASLMSNFAIYSTCTR